MCYNENVGIKITSFGDGWKDEKISVGALSRNGVELVFAYKLDGDDCKLTVNENQAVQTRRGVQNVSVAFKTGEVTLCTIGCAGFSGSYEVYTKSMKFAETESGYSLTLEYENGSEGELVKLNFTAEKIKR